MKYPISGKSAPLQKAIAKRFLIDIEFHEASTASSRQKVCRCDQTYSTIEKMWTIYTPCLPGIPAASFLIAFILGPLLKYKFRHSLLFGRDDFTIFMRNYICWFFWGLTALTVGALIYQHTGKNRSKIPGDT